MSAQQISSPEAFEEATFRKVAIRLLPILVASYIVAYLDRVNIGFARLEMMADLGFSETVYGLGAGIFFLGYFLFEVPSNLILHRVGARVWIGRIMITWGLVSASFMFVETATGFYVLRFLLGLAEAGFYPGIILYLTYWFPSGRRARMTAWFMSGIPISGVFGGPLSGWIMATFAGSNGWHGWQWLFLLEALPAIVLGIVVFFYLDDRVATAKWLTSEEKALVERRVSEDKASVEKHASLGALFADRRIWLMCLIYFGVATGQYGVTFWMPVLIQSAGVSGVGTIGMLTAIPYMAALIGMLLLGRSADRYRTRRLHVALTMIAGAIGLVTSVLAGEHTVISIVCLSIAAIGVMASPPLFWSLPTAFLQGTAAAAGIATINSVANLGGFVSPTIVGALRDATGSTAAGLFAVAGLLVVGALVALTIPSRLVDK